MCSGRRDVSDISGRVSNNIIIAYPIRKRHPTTQLPLFVSSAVPVDLEDQASKTACEYSRSRPGIIAMASIATTYRTSFSKPARQLFHFRKFSSTTSRHERYGFIGLGQMGYRMAKNLRAKLPAEDSLIVHDVNKKAAEDFVAEVGASTMVAESTRQVAEESVRPSLLFLPHCLTYCTTPMMSMYFQPYDLSWPFRVIYDSHTTSKPIL